MWKCNNKIGGGACYKCCDFSPSVVNVYNYKGNSTKQEVTFKSVYAIMAIELELFTKILANRLHDVFFCQLKSSMQ